MCGGGVEGSIVRVFMDCWVCYFHIARKNDA
jgi:hypothetical protein